MVVFISLSFQELISSLESLGYLIVYALHIFICMYILMVSITYNKKLFINSRFFFLKEYFSKLIPSKKINYIMLVIIYIFPTIVLTGLFPIEENDGRLLIVTNIYYATIISIVYNLILKIGQKKE